MRYFYTQIILLKFFFNFKIKILYLRKNIDKESKKNTSDAMNFFFLK